MQNTKGERIYKKKKNIQIGIRQCKPKESIRFRSRVRFFFLSSSECQHVLQKNVKQTSMHYIIDKQLLLYMSSFSSFLFIKTIHEAILEILMPHNHHIPSDFCLLGGIRVTTNKTVIFSLLRNKMKGIFMSVSLESVAFHISRTQLSLTTPTLPYYITYRL